MVALAVGAVVGVVRAVRTASPPVAAVAQLATVAPAPAAPAEVVGSPSRTPSDAVARISALVIGKGVAFLRVMWWVLPIPMVFSLWRQFERRPGCPHCGSSRLMPIEIAVPGP